MALTTGITERRDVPHETGEWIEFRLLSWHDLDKARGVREAVALRNMRELGGELVSSLQRATPAPVIPTPPAATPADSNGAATNGAVPSTTDLENRYDKETLLTLGIAAWSYDAPVMPDTIRALDDETATWAMGCLLGLHLMRRSEAARKNASSPSTRR